MVNYTSNQTGNTYILNTNKMVARDAQSYCNSQGGHVVAYTSYDEQSEVEGYFTSQVRLASGRNAPHLSGRQAAVATDPVATKSHALVPASHVIPTSPRYHMSMQGYLLPYYHRHYWLGLRASQPLAFKWSDPYAAAPARDTYQNWGAAGTRAAEPNNLLGFELCGAANFSQASDAAWGWSDVRCDNAYIFICMVRRECQALGLRATSQPPAPYCRRRGLHPDAHRPF